MSLTGGPPFARQVNNEMRKIKKRIKEIEIRKTTVRKATPEEIYACNVSSKKDLLYQLEKHKSGMIHLEPRNVAAIKESLTKLDTYFKEWEEEHGKI